MLFFFQRRPILTRERMVHAINIEKLDDIHYELNLKTQAGTYLFNLFVFPKVLG